MMYSRVLDTRSCQAQLCAVLRDPPPCRAGYAELLRHAWGCYLLGHDIASVRALAPPRPDVRLWANLAEAAAWYTRIQALECLEAVEVEETTPAARYVRHQIYIYIYI